MASTDNERPDFKHVVVAQGLRRRIVSGLLAPGMKLPSREELARQFRVSVETTHRAVEELKEQRFLFARRKAGTFVTEHPPHLYQFGLVFLTLAPARTVSNYWRALAEAAAAFEPQGPRRVQVFDQVRVEASESYQQLKRYVMNRRVAGLIFATAPNELDHTPIVKHPGIPRIAITSPDGCSPNVRSMHFNFDRFFDAAMSAFVERRRRRIAVIAHGFNADIMNPLARALDRFGLTSHPRWNQSPMYERTAVRNAAMILASAPQGHRPDGLLILDDNYVEPATEGLLAMGVRVPQEMTVVAHANFPLITPSRVPAVRVGWDVPRLLARCVENLANPRARQNDSFEPTMTTLTPRGSA